MTIFNKSSETEYVDRKPATNNEFHDGVRQRISSETVFLILFQGCYCLSRIPKQWRPGYTNINFFNLFILAAKCDISHWTSIHSKCLKSECSRTYVSSWKTVKTKKISNFHSYMTRNLVLDRPFLYMEYWNLCSSLWRIGLVSRTDRQTSRQPLFRRKKDKRDDINKDLKVIGCEDRRLMRVFQNDVQKLISVIMELYIRALKPA
jgi:hypothetical protein